jgi:hypothetical protein
MDHVRRAVADNAAVPRLATFYGIVIWMYRPDHPPPHFHAQYGGDVAQIELATLRILTGRFLRVRYDSSGRGPDSILRSLQIIGRALRNFEPLAPIEPLP